MGEEHNFGANEIQKFQEDQLCGGWTLDAQATNKRTPVWAPT